MLSKDVIIPGSHQNTLLETHYSENTSYQINKHLRRSRNYHQFENLSCYRGMVGRLLEALMLRTSAAVGHGTLQSYRL